jgi:hypothetical protein
MADIERSRGPRPPRRQREQRAYQLTMATGALALVTVVGLVLAIAGVLSLGLPIITGILAAVCFVLLRRQLGM